MHYWLGLAVLLQHLFSTPILVLGNSAVVNSRDDLLYASHNSVVSVLKYHYLLYSKTDVCDSLAQQAWGTLLNKAMRIVAPFSIDSDFGFKLLLESEPLRQSISGNKSCLFVALEKGTPRSMVTHVIRPNLFVHFVRNSNHHNLNVWLQDIQKVEIGVTAAYLGQNVLVECASNSGVQQPSSELFELAPGMHAGCYTDLGSTVRVFTNYQKVGDNYSGFELNKWTVESNGVYYTSYVDEEGEVRNLTKSRMTSVSGREDHEDNVYEKAGVQVSEKHRWALVRDMMNTSLERSREVRRTFSPQGFKLGRLPNDLWASMSAYYHNSRERSLLEFWSPTHVITNHHESSTAMMFPPLVLRSYWQRRLLVLVQRWLDERVPYSSTTAIPTTSKTNSFSDHFKGLGGNAYTYGSDRLDDVHALSPSSEDSACAKDTERKGTVEATEGVHEDTRRACYRDKIARSRFSIQQTSLYGVREYKGQSRLLQHVDIKSTHAASIIINVAQSGVKEPWPLEIFDHSNRLHEVVMAEGDILYYESARNVHARTNPFLGQHFANIFAHYRPLLPGTDEGDAMWFSRENPFGTPPPERHSCPEKSVVGVRAGKRGGGGRGLSGSRSGSAIEEVREGDLWLNPAVTLQTEQDLLDQWRDNMNDGADREAYY